MTFITSIDELPALVTKREAAAFLRVDLRTITRMIARGDLKAVHLGTSPHSPVRIARAELLRIASGERP